MRSIARCFVISLLCLAICHANAESVEADNPQATPAATPTATPLTLDTPLDFKLPASLDPLYACACGCGVFDVGTATMLPQGQGGMIWLEYDYSYQNRNWNGSKSAPRADNPDKAIRTDYFTAGLQYFFNRQWGVQVEVPFEHRLFKTIQDSGALGSTEWTSLGDIRIKGIYTGLTEDLSVGVNMGLKLPTGDFTHPDADRDTEIGSGSTDLLLGGYYRTTLTNDALWNAFANVEFDLPILTRDRYRPGYEANGAVGIYYTGFTVRGVKIVPLGQMILSARTSDGGDNSAHPVASGYERVILSPGIEFHVHPFMIYADIEVPVYQYTKGEQLTAPAAFKVLVSYSF